MFQYGQREGADRKKYWMDEISSMRTQNLKRIKKQEAH